MKRAGILVASWILSTAVAVAEPSATDGGLDKKFNHTGQLSIAGPADEELLASDLELQADGKIVVLAQRWRPTVPNVASDVYLARIRPDGSFDASFDGDGRLISDPLQGLELPRAMALQKDGKIVVAGVVQNAPTNLNLIDGFIARYLASGAPDASFGGGAGAIRLDLEVLDELQDVIVQADGKIVVAGFSTGLDGLSRLVLARFKPNGQPDLPFGGANAGFVQTLLNGDGANAFRLVLQKDRKILVAGHTGSFLSPTGLEPIVARFLSSGRLDLAFGGGDGFVLVRDPLVDPLVREVASDVVVLTNGSILVSGGRAAADSRSGSWAVHRLDSSGRPDTSFGSHGLVRVELNAAYEGGVGLLPAGGGRLVLYGGSNAGLAPGFPVSRSSLARLNANGTLDPSFGVGGKASFPLSPQGSGFVAVALQKDGLLVALSAVRGQDSSRLVVSRHLAKP
jgi:uncharacterized delta-60 repeat protein